MNVSFVVVIVAFFVTNLFVLSSWADDGKSIQKRILKLKNVNFNKTNAKPSKSTKKSQKNKTIFVLTNPVIYPQKPLSPKPSTTTTTESVVIRRQPTNHFDFLNFDAYILKPRNINYTALLSHPNSKAQEQNYDSPQPTTSYPQNEFLDFARAEPLIQTTVPAILETIPFETTSHKTKKSEIKAETTTATTVNSFFPLGLAYFDSLRKYRNAFESLRKRERTKKPRTKKTPSTTTTSTTTTTTTTTTFTPTTTTETEEPFTEITTKKDYDYVVTPNFDEDLYEEPHFESYRYKPHKPRYYHNYEDEIERNRYETTTRYLDYDTFDREHNRYESTEAISTTTRPSNSRRRKPKNKNVHSSNVKSNYLYDRYTNYPQEDESRRVVSVARPGNYKDKRSVRNNTQPVDKKGTGGRDGEADGTERTGGGEKQKHRNTIPMQRHYFQYVNAINDGAYNAGVGKGNQDHYIEQHELSVPKNGTFQKRVRWNDKRGGFGELYYDLNHH